MQISDVRYRPEAVVCGGEEMMTFASNTRSLAFSLLIVALTQLLG